MIDCYIYGRGSTLVAADVSELYALIARSLAYNAHDLEDCVLPVVESASFTESGDPLDSAHAFAKSALLEALVSLVLALVSDVLLFVSEVLALVAEVFASVSLALALVSEVLACSALVAALEADVAALASCVPSFSIEASALAALSAALVALV